MTEGTRATLLLWILAAAAVALSAPVTGHAQVCNAGDCSQFNLPARRCGLPAPTCVPGTSYPPGHPCHGSGCNGIPNCRPLVVPETPELEILDQGGGTKTARMVFEVFAPWNAESPTADLALFMIWFDTGTVCEVKNDAALCQHLSAGGPGVSLVGGVAYMRCRVRLRD